MFGLIVFFNGALGCFDWYRDIPIRGWTVTMSCSISHLRFSICNQHTEFQSLFLSNYATLEVQETKSRAGNYLC